MDALVRWGTVAPEDLELFHRADTPQEAFDYLIDNIRLCRGRRFT